LCATREKNPKGEEGTYNTTKEGIKNKKMSSNDKAPRRAPSQVITMVNSVTERAGENTIEKKVGTPFSSMITGTHPNSCHFEKSRLRERKDPGLKLGSNQTRKGWEE